MLIPYRLFLSWRGRVSRDQLDRSVSTLEEQAGNKSSVAEKREIPLPLLKRRQSWPVNAIAQLQSRIKSIRPIVADGT